MMSLIIADGTHNSNPSLKFLICVSRNLRILQANWYAALHFVHAKNAAIILFIFEHFFG